MRGEQNGAVLHQAPDQTPDLDDLRRVEPQRGLVQDQQPRTVENSLGQPHPLAVSLAQMPDRTCQVVGKSRGVDRLREASHLLLLRNLAQLGHHLQVCLDRELRVEGGALRQVADVRLHVTCVCQYIQTVHVGGAAIGLQVTGQNLDRGRLAGTVGSKQPNDFARCNVKGDPTQGFDGAV